jgi:hypothetical protein
VKKLVFIALIALAACGSTKPPPVPAPAPPPSGPVEKRMETFTQNGYELTGAEYWPYVGANDIDYPKDVLWGFYPQKGVVPPGETDPNPASASAPAMECARTSWEALHAFVETTDHGREQVRARADIECRRVVQQIDYGDGRRNALQHRLDLAYVDVTGAEIGKQHDCHGRIVVPENKKAGARAGFVIAQVLFRTWRLPQRILLRVPGDPSIRPGPWARCRPGGSRT